MTLLIKKQLDKVRNIHLFGVINVARNVTQSVAKSAAKIAAYSMVFAAVSPAYAILSVTPQPLPAITFNAWGGFTGDFVGISDICIISTRGNSTNRRRNYDVAGYQVTPGGTTGFVIQHTVSGHRLDVTFQFLDTSGTLHTLTNYSVTGFITPLIQGPRNCTEGAAQIILTLPAAEIAVAQAGVYQATMGFDVLQQNGQYTGVLPFQVTMPELVEITRLDDVNMVGPVGSDIVAVEDFCIFRNGAGGFSISATGNNDSGGNYHVRDTVNVRYTVEVGQGGSFATLTPGASLSAGATGFSGISARDCGGIDNTQIRLRITDADASAAPYGIYTDTLVILVAPD